MLLYIYVYPLLFVPHYIYNGNSLGLRGKILLVLNNEFCQEVKK